MNSFKRKYIFIVNPPRGGGFSISNLRLIKDNSQIFLWPYEFFYFNLFNQASKNKKKELGAILNEFFYNEIKMKLYKFTKKKINYKSLKKNLKKSDNILFNSKKYLEHLIFSLNASFYKKSICPKYLMINTTVRGFDWTMKIPENYFFILSNRKLEECFKSIRAKTLGASDFYNFYSFRGKKSFFYWLESFNQINKINNMKSLKKLIINFEDKNLKLIERKEICSINSSKILNFFKIKKKYKLRNFYFSVHKKFRKKNYTMCKIENFLINTYMQDKRLSFFNFCKNLFFSFNYFFVNLKNMNFISRILKTIMIIFNFIYYYSIKNDKVKFFNLLVKPNNHIKYMGLMKR